MDARDHRRFLRTPLALAVEGGHVVAASMLLGHGAHVDASDADGRTPLFRCAQRNYVPSFFCTLAGNLLALFVARCSPLFLVVLFSYFFQILILWHKINFPAGFI